MTSTLRGGQTEMKFDRPTQNDMPMMMKCSESEPKVEIKFNMAAVRFRKPQM